MESNKEIFDKADGTSNDEPQESELSIIDNVETPKNDMDDAPEDFEDDFSLGELNDSDDLEIILPAEELDDEKVHKDTFIIESAEIVKPKTRDVDGNKIEPTVFNPKKPDRKGYQTKLKVTYKNTNYVSWVPNVKWYLGRKDPRTGRQALNPWFLTKITEDKLDDHFTAEIAKVYFKFCIKNGYEVGKISQAQFVKELPGKSVKLKQYAKEYENSMRHRIDIHEFV